MTTDAPERPKTPLELPQAMWVRGGTTSQRHDEEVARSRADADARRAVEDARERLVLDNPLEARLRSLNLTDSSRDPCIVLYVRDTPKIRAPEDLKSEQSCELISQPLPYQFRGAAFQLILQMICPACFYRHDRRMSEAQIHVQQINRYFWLDEKRKGELVVLQNGDTVFLAGEVTSETSMTCPNLGCGFRFRIEKNVIIQV